MSTTQFAMVEELAFLIKDNLPCKHLILTMEEALVNLLEDNTSLDTNLELEPMNSYNRLLMHRLADIFGFSHESVGEGDDRHLILERNPETNIPSILVSDILWQYDETPSHCPSPLTSHQLLKRKETPPAMSAKAALQHSLEQREAAYLAARERIFKADAEVTREPVRQKPRSVPIVARRMIAHALGQRIKHCDQEVTMRDCKESEGTTSEYEYKHNKTSLGSSPGFLKPNEDRPLCDTENPNDYSPRSLLTDERNVCQEPDENKPTNVGISRNSSSGNVSKDSMKEERVGAAKRMFALALGRSSMKDDSPKKSSEIKIKSQT